MRILVTGATGTVGGSVATTLARTSHQVVALVRDPAAYEAPVGVEVVQGDLTVADDVRRALDGVDRAFLNMADDNGATFAAEAGRAELDHVVLLSSFTAVTELPLGADNIVTARHRAGEQALAEAGVPSTFLRASGFDYNFLMWASEAGTGIVRAPWLDVPLPVVDPDDIADAAVAVLTAESPAGGAHSITGPERLTVADQTRVASSVLGRELRAEELDLDVAKANAFPEGTPPVVVDSVFGTFGPEAAVLPVSSDVETLTGRPARTFEQWVEAHRAAFA